MVYVLFNLRTTYVGCDAKDVYEVEEKEVYNEDGSLNETFLDDVGNVLAQQNAEMYGIEVDEDSIFEPEPYSFDYEVLTGTREEIEEDYGCINHC